MAIIRLEFENGEVITLHDDDITASHKDMHLWVFGPNGEKLIDVGRGAVAQGIEPGVVYYNNAYALDGLIPYLPEGFIKTGFDKRILRLVFKAPR